MKKATDASNLPQPQFLIEPLEERIQFSNIIDWALSVIHNQDPKSVYAQGSYDPKISLLPFGQK